MKTLGEMIQEAYMKVETAEKDDVAMIKSWTDESKKKADKSYLTARDSVKKLYQLFDQDVPEMQSIHSVSWSLERLYNRYTKFWEDLANSKI